jgi:hypothetical protein
MWVGDRTARSPALLFPPPTPGHPPAMASVAPRQRPPRTGAARAVQARGATRLPPRAADLAGGRAESPSPPHRPHARPARRGHATRGGDRAALPPACPRPRVALRRAVSASTSLRSLTERRSPAPAGPPRIVARPSVTPAQAVDQRPVSVGCAACAQHPERSRLPGQRAASHAVKGLPLAARAGVPWSCPDQPATAAPGRHGSR